MRSAELREYAFHTLLNQEGIIVDTKSFKKHRARGGGMETMGGIYYGSHYFNPSQRSGNCPELQLTKSALRGHIRTGVTQGYGSDLFSVWVLGFGELLNMVKQPTHDIIDWSFYSFVFIADGVVMVFPANRPKFARQLAAISGTNSIWSCSALRAGHRPNPFGYEGD